MKPTTETAAPSVPPSFASLASNQRVQWTLIGALAIVTTLLPLFVRNEGYIDALANAFAFAALALGLNIVVGYAGLLDLGYAAFFAIGAYTYGVFASWQVVPPWNDLYAPLEWLGLVARVHRSGGDFVHFQVSFWLMLPISALVAAFFGILFGAPTLRLRGDYLAIVTLGFGEIVPIVARNVPSLTNGAQGLTGVASPSLFGHSFSVASVPYFYLGFVLLAFLIVVSVRLKTSRIGRAWMAIREDEIAAEATGVNRARLKLLAFATGAAFAGMTGAFYVAKLQTATPEMFMFPVSVMILVMIVFGGIGSVPGVVLGAILLHLLQAWFLPDLSEWLHTLGARADWAFLQRVELAQATELIFGIILVVMMLFRRQGLLPSGHASNALSVDEQTALPFLQRAEAPLGQHALAGEPLLEIRGLRKSFGGIRAINGLDLVVPSGSIFAIIGPNGSGKTTLFNVVTGLDSADAGSVFLAGQKIVGLAPDAIVARGMARTFQNLRLFGNMTVLENVLVGGHIRSRAGIVGAVFGTRRTRMEEADIRARSLSIISSFGNRLLPRLNHLARSLSYANRRRLEIARAVMTRPRILLLDEPAAGMNPSETLELVEQIRALRDAGLTVLLIEHKLEVVNEIADRVIVLDHGEKITEGTPDEVYRDEKVLGAYLGRKSSVRSAS